MLLIRGGKIKPITGDEIENGELLIGDDGKIAAIGSKVNAPEGVEVLDASGCLIQENGVQQVIPVIPEYVHQDSTGAGDAFFAGVTIGLTYGKTMAEACEIGTRLAAQLGRTFLDADTVLDQKAGMNIPEIFRLEGEDGFRQRETAVLAELGKRSGLVIATGGGCVTREENYDLLHQNGIIFWLKRDIDQLPREGRPLSAGDLAAMYDRRKACYERFADHIVDNNGTVEDTVQAILDCLK